MIGRNARLAAALVAATTVLGACSSGGPAVSPSGGTGSERTTVTLRHSWVPDDLFLPVAVAKANGFYAEVGINLVDQVGNGGATSVQLVANGDINIGVGEASHVITARSQDLPIINIATQIQDLPSAVIALKGSNITTWQDLVGKKVGGTVASSGYAAFLASLKLQGIDPDSVTHVNLPPGAQLTALPTGEIDAALTFLGNVAALEYKDDLNIITYASSGLKAPSTGFFVTESFLAQNKDLLTRFLKATMKGLRYTLDHPDEAAEALSKQWANVKAEDVAAKWNLNLQFVDTDAVKEHGLGWQNADAWKAMADVLLETDGIDKAVDTTKAFTNELIDAIPTEER